MAAEVIPLINLDNLWLACNAIVLAITGRLAYLLSVKDNVRLSWGYIAAELFTAGFIGVMTLKFARLSGLDGDWLGIACGVAGWTSPIIMRVLTRWTERVLGLDKNDLKGANK